MALFTFLGGCQVCYCLRYALMGGDIPTTFSKCLHLHCKKIWKKFDWVLHLITVLCIGVKFQINNLENFVNLYMVRLWFIKSNWIIFLPISSFVWSLHQIFASHVFKYITAIFVCWHHGIQWWGFSCYNLPVEGSENSRTLCKLYSWRTFVGNSFF